jgi:hypothetical protein
VSAQQHTDVEAPRTKRELRHCFELWPEADFVAFPENTGEPEAKAIVVFDFQGQRVRVDYNRRCHYRCNLRAIYLTLNDMRLAYYRGLGDVLMHTVSQMLALPGAAYIDPYELLGVRPDADLEDIEAMYKIKAKRAHPDAGGSHDQMTNLNAAIERIRSDRAEGVPA